MKKIIVLFIASNVLTNANAQPVYDLSHSPYLETVACAPSFTDAFSCAVNPAAVPDLNGFAIGGYVERKFDIEGLDLALVSVQYGSKRNGIGLYLKYFGSAAYNETHTALNYGKDLGNIKIGTSISYNKYGIAGFIKESVFSFSFYSILKFSDKFYSSFQPSSPSFAQFGTNGIKQKWVHDLGFTYQSSPALCFSFNIEKEEDIPLQVKSALQFRSSKKFYLKAGICTAGPQPFIGLGWRFKTIETQFSLCYHPELGATPGVLFGYKAIKDELSE